MMLVDWVTSGFGTEDDEKGGIEEAAKGERGSSCEGKPTR
jgi:hypothetical protein